MIRAHAKLSILIFQTLALTLVYDFFGRHRERSLLPEPARKTQGWGFSGDALIGLSFKWVQPVQSFVF